jgi:extracellular elastinolytic metalloproteinase
MRFNSTKSKTLSVMMLLMFSSISAWSQLQNPVETAIRHLQENKNQWNLTEADIADLVVTDNYVSTPSGASMVYLMQRYQGIKVYNAIYNVGISKEGKVVHAASRIVPNIVNKVGASTSPSLTPEAAIAAALSHLNVTMSDALVQKERKNEQEFVFEKGAYSNTEIKVNLQFFPTNENEVELAWEVVIDMVSNADYWNVKVDAATGNVLGQHNYTTYCTFAPDAYHNHDVACRSLDNMRIVTSAKKTTVAPPVLLGGSYAVFADQTVDGNLHTHESPSHGARNLLTGIEDLAASPYGWHDTNGQNGPEFTITRGNNVHAYLDLDGSNNSQGDEPDGGAELLFDFPIDLDAEPETFQAASVTNGFFMSNVMHDFSYVHGFDEAAGNFQSNNYGNGGNGGDFVNMHIDDGSGTNNANFSTPPDGSNGTMQMFLWNTTAASGLLTVNEPASVAGIYEVAHPGDWGGQIDMTPLTAEVAIVDDGTGFDGSKGCNELVNVADVTGKIAIVDRGLCQFGTKALMAQNAGAVGVIICNFEDATIGMAGGDDGAQVTIPVIMIGLGLCTDLRAFAGNGLSLTFVEQPTGSGPDNISGSLDNGIIAHEYGHGISNRLVGGGNNTGCLGNGEQMGEGISDFFSLVTTVKPGDTGEMGRGIGTFAQREDTDGGGIRRYPYSTDMSVNPLTYKDIAGQTAPHPIGEIWTLCLWEMYWLLVDEYGFDEDLFNGAGGNNIAVLLAIEGMKLTSCNPGYTDGRDGVLAADQLIYGGANQCLIWKAFAKRGVGINTDQVSSFDSNDGIENFERPIECLDEIQIAKSVNELINPGEDIDVVIDIRNYKQSVSTNVIVTDEIPNGATVLPSSIVGPGTVSGNTITFVIGVMAIEEVTQVSYTLETDPSIKSIASFNDDQEGDPDDNWDIEFLNGTTIFDVRDDSLAYSGETAWFIQDVAVENDQTLFIKNPIAVTGTQPVLRFYHWYDTEAGADGGLLEVSKDGGTIWEQTGSAMFRHEYPRALQYGTLVIPFLSAFSGQSSAGGEDFVATYVDMSDYLGEDILIRFRFASDDNTSGKGWFIDDVTFMDMRNYEGVACVSTDQGDNNCTSVEERGTAVNPEETVGNKNLFKTNMEVNVFPNPAQDILNIQVLNDKSADAAVRILTVDGKEMMDKSFRVVDGLQTMSVNVARLPAGMYFVKVSTNEGIVVEKVMIK